MSEYQYYEFAALDQPLTKAQQAELRACSSRAEITTGSFVNEYHWGDLKADPFEWMEDYFDAHVYSSNFGYCRLMLRLPKDALSASDAAATAGGPARRGRYGGDAFSIHSGRKHWILDWSFNGEGDEDERFYTESDGAGWMARLAPLRDELLRGDQRPLYLGWLARLCSCELDDDALEPPVPPGLDDLTPAQLALAEFLLLDPDLLAVAQAASPVPATTSRTDAEMDEWISSLPPAQLRDTARSLLAGDGLRVERSLRGQYLAWLRERRPARTPQHVRRTVAQIEAARPAVEQARVERERVEQQAIDARRQAERARSLSELAGRANSVWKDIDLNLQAGSGAAYERAQRSVVELAQALNAAGREAEFRRGLVKLLSTHGHRKAWIERLHKAGLM
ncbi:hypothetical protein [Pseudoduganella violaceinigra]|uniref:hypothetical protein n=1 Tax=Pseudoduganella violaceinigra TaxID=246602 RepID=UPI0004144006|nr:hypothetical protein [Pseudoduganella violaceinigra]